MEFGVLQAVVMADIHEKKLNPFDETRSTGLIPVANIALIDYVLESLNRSNVNEVFVFATSYIEDVHNHIRQGVDESRPWSLQMCVRVIKLADCVSLGDALRYLYFKNLLHTHFLLLNADTVSNIDFRKLFSTHLERVQSDTKTTMTAVYCKGNPGVVTSQDVTVLHESETKRLLFYDRFYDNGDGGTKAAKRKHCFPLDIFNSKSPVEIRADLTDPEISVCSVGLLSVFVDNFDFQNIRDFLNFFLCEKYPTNTIYLYEVPDGQYAARVADWQLYGIVGRAIINRRTYPLVPDAGVNSLCPLYTFCRNNIYIAAKKQTLDRKSIDRGLIENVVVGADCLLGEEIKISNSVLGKGCSIGRESVLENTHLLDGVRVGARCFLQNCVIGQGSKLLDDCRVLDGAVIGDHCELPNGQCVSRALVLAKIPPQNELDDGGDGFQQIGISAFIAGESEIANLGAAQFRRFTQPGDDYSSDNDENSENAPVAIDDADAKGFFEAVKEQFGRVFEFTDNGFSSCAENTILEINASRFAHNISVDELSFFIIQAFLDSMEFELMEKHVMLTIRKQFVRFQPILEKYICNDRAMEKCLDGILEFCLENEPLHTKLGNIIHFFYQKNLLTEEIILLCWFERLNLNERKDDGWPASMLQLIEWLKSENSESE